MENSNNKWDQVVFTGNVMTFSVPVIHNTKVENWRLIVYHKTQNLMYIIFQIYDTVLKSYSSMTESSKNV
jgi:hypothetical protein